MNRFCYLIVFACCLLCLLTAGCGESSKSPEEEGVVRKKISLPSKESHLLKKSLQIRAQTKMSKSIRQSMK